MDFSYAYGILSQHGQTHLLDYYDKLTEKQKRILLEQISQLDFSAVDGLLLDEKANEEEGEYSPVTALTQAQLNAESQKFFNVGSLLLRQGKVAAVLLAGGQGSRLGFNGPKGTFNIGVNKTLSIFGQQFNNMLKVVKSVGTFFTVFIMTSSENHGQTIEFFKQNDYFGFPKSKIRFFIQKASPVCDFNGKILMEDKYKIAFAPNGNGGWFSSLMQSDCGKVIKAEGIEWLNVYSVDNVLQQICDPLFIGATASGNFECGAKVVKKVSPQENVGVLLLQNGKPSVVEYYELDEKIANERDENGELKYKYGVILNYLFSVKALSAASIDELPYHYAKKIIPYFKDGERVCPAQPNAYKPETLIVDIIKRLNSCLAVEVEREKEFAPVKNKTGTDSVESAQRLLIQNGIII